MKKGKMLAALFAIAVGIAAIIPVVAHYLFAALGWIFTMLGAGFAFLAAWFAKASDEPHEKAIWGGILLFLTFAMIYYFGLPLLQYWWLIAVVFIIFALAVINIKFKERRRRKRK
ncbi:MAG TPA: hypothetical protein ENI53_00880 [Thermoplasmatales archaeon]|nr:hypothetical protein [Thermoplasmatales archaeon]